MDAPIVVERVSHHYGRGALRREILHDVSAEIGAGEIVILTGPSGSGKTTLLTLIGALRSAQEGSVRVLGEELRGAREARLVGVRRRIGYIFQQHNLLESLTVAQNVRMARQLGGAGEDRVEAVLQQVGLADHLRKRPGELSGGQRQRVAVARALVNRPRIVLADEPTASLDKRAGRDVVDLIRRLAREEGASVVLVTHDSRILDIADRILSLEDGCIQPLREAVASDANRMLQLLSRHDPSSHRSLVAFALSLARVAQADRVVTAAEVTAIRKALVEVGGLARGEVDLVVGLALHRVGADGADGGAVGLDPEQRGRLTRSLHAVAGADGEVSEEERREIERIVAEFGDAGARPR